MRLDSLMHPLARQLHYNICLNFPRDFHTIWVKVAILIKYEQQKNDVIRNDTKLQWETELDSLATVLERSSENIITGIHSTFWGLIV